MYAWMSVCLAAGVAHASYSEIQIGIFILGTTAAYAKQLIFGNKTTKNGSACECLTKDVRFIRSDPNRCGFPNAAL